MKLNNNNLLIIIGIIILFIIFHQKFRKYENFADTNAINSIPTNLPPPIVPTYNLEELRKQFDSNLNMYNRYNDILKINSKSKIPEPIKDIYNLFKELDSNGQLTFDNYVKKISNIPSPTLLSFKYSSDILKDSANPAYLRSPTLTMGVNNFSESTDKISFGAPINLFNDTDLSSCKPKTYYEDIVKLDNNVCSKKCCNFYEWDGKPSELKEKGMTPELETILKDKYIGTNMSCNFGTGGGCLCVNKKQFNYLTIRGGNGGSA